MLTPDPYQQAFLDHPHSKGEAVRLKAVAGAGKTTTSVMKIKSLIEDGIDPASIVFITFSNKAAKDLHKKYTKLTGMSARPEMSTCHSFSLKLLRKYFDVKVNLLNDWGSTLMMRDAIEQLGFGKNYECKDMRALSGLAREFLNVTHWYKSILASEQPILQTDLSDFSLYDVDSHPDTNIAPNHFNQAFDLYETFKQNAGQMDYSDLLFVLYTKLKQNPDVLAQIQKDYPVFFVDECQDCDHLMMKLVYTLSASNSLYTIYDASQTIYGFRWAAPYMLDEAELLKYFPSVYTFALKFNYRSTANIVNLGNKVRSVVGDPVMAQPFRPEVPGSVRYIKVKNNKSEGKVAVKVINESLSAGHGYKDIVILARTNNYLKTIIEPTLVKEGIPYKLSTKNRRKLFEKPVVQLYFDLISLVLTPGNHATLMSLAPHIKGIGDSFISKMKSMSYAGKSYAGKSIFDVTLPPADTRKLNILRSISDSIEECSGVYDPTNLAGVLNRFQEIVFLYCPKDFTTTKDLEILHKALSTMVFGYYDDFMINDLQEILEKVLLDFADIETEQEKDAVTLMTVHGSKGLEFPVTIAGDHARAMEREEDHFDEGCILYVQLSRAIESLVVLDSQVYIDYRLQERKAVNSGPFKKFKEAIGTA